MRYLLKLTILAYMLGAPSQVAAGELQWLGLFKWDMVAWLENAHRLKQLCPDSLSLADKTLCLIEKRKPLSLALKVYAEPDGEAVGELTVTATPGEGLSAVFQAADGTEATEFKPDLHDADWRYGPYFHQTVIARQDNWFRLAQNPFPKPVWLNGDDLGEKIPVEKVANDKVYRLGEESVVIIAVDAKTVTLRAEQPADMWCDEDEPPALEAGTEKPVKHKKLFDEDGHLRLRVKYTEGCDY